MLTYSGGIIPSIFAHNTKVPKTGSKVNTYITLPYDLSPLLNDTNTIIHTTAKLKANWNFTVPYTFPDAK